MVKSQDFVVCYLSCRVEKPSLSPLPFINIYTNK